MAAYQDSSPSIGRPVPQHRVVPSTPSQAIPARHHGRNHAHSVSLGTINHSHRVARRKSMSSSTANNVAMMLAAMQGREEGMGHGFDRRNASHRISHRGFLVNNGAMGGEYSSEYKTPAQMDSSTHDEAMMDDTSSPVSENVKEKETPSTNNVKGRSRRASEGAYLSKSDGKRASGELRCEKCGKGYKHSSCLTKHLWEHTPEWSLTSKLLISKHQQVQLLEAASVLVNMNLDAPLAEDASKPVSNESDKSSASPAVSGYSDPQYSDPQNEDISSAETTPPPSEDVFASAMAEARDPKRLSSTSSIFSRSYQSNAQGSISASSVPTAASFGSVYQMYPRRPSTSDADMNLSLADDEAGLAAAIELCNFGTPRTAPTFMDNDIPPVPPLPQRYQAHNAKRISGGHGFAQGGQQGLDLPPPLTHRISDERGSKRHSHQPGSVHLNDDDDAYFDRRSVSRGRSDEDEDGVFGRMEE